MARIYQRERTVRDKMSEEVTTCVACTPVGHKDRGVWFSCRLLPASLGILITEPQAVAARSREKDIYPLSVNL